MTEDELMRLPKDGYKYELVDGKVTGVPLFMNHGARIMRVFWLLVDMDGARGRVISSNLGCRMKNGNIRTPDGGFLLRGRVPTGSARDEFLDGAPDLAVEVLSAAEDPQDIQRKITEYLESGSRQVWIVSPDDGTVMVYGVTPGPLTHKGDDVLDGGDLLPGFRHTVAEILDAE
jgi:Uma2 family endonuclease